MNRFKNIEQVAKLLLKRCISFEYSYNYLKVTDPDTRGLIFDSASYISGTNEVVCMIGYGADNREVSKSEIVRMINAEK